VKQKPKVALSSGMTLEAYARKENTKQRGAKKKRVRKKKSFFSFFFSFFSEKKQRRNVSRSSEQHSQARCMAFKRASARTT